MAACPTRIAPSFRNSFADSMKMKTCDYVAQCFVFLFFFHILFSQLSVCSVLYTFFLMETNVRRRLPFHVVILLMMYVSRASECSARKQIFLKRFCSFYSFYSFVYSFFSSLLCISRVTKRCHSHTGKKFIYTFLNRFYCVAKNNMVSVFEIRLSVFDLSNI